MEKAKARFLQNNDEWLCKSVEIPRAQASFSDKSSKSCNALSEIIKRRKTSEKQMPQVYSKKL